MPSTARSRETTRARAIGLVHWLTHPSTWSAGPYCYLEDLFVHPDARGSGVGRGAHRARARLGGRITAATRCTGSPSAATTRRGNSTTGSRRTPTSCTTRSSSGYERSRRCLNSFFAFGAIGESSAIELAHATRDACRRSRRSRGRGVMPQLSHASAVRQVKPLLAAQSPQQGDAAHDRREDVRCRRGTCACDHATAGTASGRHDRAERLRC